MPLIEKIASGGQTGADRAALDWAIENGIAHGGWCPKGGLTPRTTGIKTPPRGPAPERPRPAGLSGAPARTASRRTTAAGLLD